MGKQGYKEENKEYYVPEYYSFEHEEFSFQNETYRNNKESYKQNKEDNKTGEEENKSTKASGKEHSESKNLEDITKHTSRATTAIKTVVITGSSVAIVVGGVMIYNENILPPSHVEIVEAYAYENNIGFMVYASNFDEEDKMHGEEAFGEPCDLEIELYGNGEVLSFHMEEMGYFYEEFTGLKYDTEYELCVYQNIALGLERPLLASTKIRTESEDSIRKEFPQISEITFEKYTSSDTSEIVVSFTFNVSDLDGFYSDYEFNLYEFDTGESVGEIYLEKDEETGTTYYGSIILTEFRSETFLYELSVLSTHPDHLVNNEPSRITVTSGNFNLFEITELNEHLYDPQFFGITFERYSYPDGSSEDYFYLYFEDMNSYWTGMFVEIEYDGQTFASNASEDLHDKQYLDVYPPITDSAIVRVYAYSINPDDLQEGMSEAEVLIHEETYDFSSISIVEGYRQSEFFSATFSKHEGETVMSVAEFMLGVTLYYIDDSSYWSDFAINITKEGGSVYYGELQGVSEELEIINGFDIASFSGIYHITITCNSSDPEESNAATGAKVLYDEDVDFDSL